MNPAAVPSAADEALAEALARNGLTDFELAIVLGSGLADFAERLEDARSVSFEELDDMPQSRVPGHAGRFVQGGLAGRRVLVQAGRVHLYEGWSPQTVTRSVRAFARLGCRRLVLTNAAGGLNRDWPVPSLMRITDHLDLQGASPLRAGEAGRGSPYDAELGEALDRAADRAGVQLFRGMYAGLLGPSYETPAEVALLGRWGAQAIGMSTVAEAQVGYACGMAVAAVSCIANPAAGMSPAPLAHEEVVAAGRAVADDLCALLAGLSAEL